MNRRHFIKSLVIGSGAISVPLLVKAEPQHVMFTKQVSVKEFVDRYSGHTEDWGILPADEKERNKVINYRLTDMVNRLANEH